MVYPAPMEVEASEIIPLLWQGSKPPTGPALKAHGFGMVILCAREYQPDDFPGVKVIHAPNDDVEETPDRETLDEALRAAGWASRAMKQGTKVLVTCQAGLNRSGLVSALTLHRHLGVSGEEAILAVQLGRNPSKIAQDIGGALFNEAFCTVLRKLPGQGKVDTKNRVLV